jgi:hypothetical protein
MAHGVDTGRITHDPEMHRHVQWKAPVRVATTANGTLASAFEAGDTVDGITLALYDRILLKNQSADEFNGIYVVQASGAPLRAYDMDQPNEVPGAIVYVMAGTANAGHLYVCTNLTDPVLDDDPITFTDLGGGPFQPLDADLTAIAAITRNRGDIIRGGAAAWEDLALGTDGKLLASDGTDAVWETQYASITFDIGTIGGSVPATGIKGIIGPVDFAYTLEANRMAVSPSGSAVIDLWQGTIAEWIAGTVVDADSITASAPMTVSSALGSEDTTLTGWTVNIAAGKLLVVNLDSVTTAQYIHGELKVRKT